MRTRWGVVAVVGLAGLALAACGQQGVVEVAKEETRTTSLEPNKIPVAGAPLRVEAGDLKVVETVEKASGKVISRFPHPRDRLARAAAAPAGRPRWAGADARDTREARHPAYCSTRQDPG